MKTNWIVCLLAGLCLTGCLPENPAPEPIAPNEDVDVLYQQFHGKYQLVSSISSQAVDVNLDGQTSTNMMGEIPELAWHEGTQYGIELRITGSSQYKEERKFTFLQVWPEQYIRIGNEDWKGEYLDYLPNRRISYVTQGAIHNFSFSTDLKQITVNSGQNENPFRWVRPESVTVENNGRLRVVNKRRLYTRAGVKEVLITTMYERYTMIT